LGGKKTDSDAVFDVRDDAAQSHELIGRWLVAFDEGSENAFVSRERLIDVIEGLKLSTLEQAESVPEGGVSGVLRQALMTRVIELESTRLLLGEVAVDRPDPAWRALLRAWIEAAQAKSGLISAHAEDAAKRLSGAKARRHRADENNPQLINAIRLYRVYPVSNEPRSARTIARILRNGNGFSTFTQRRSEEALAKLIQRILKKLSVPG
jgi:hypothetical protein